MKFLCRLLRVVGGAQVAVSLLLLLLWVGLCVAGPRGGVWLKYGGHGLALYSYDEVSGGGRFGYQIVRTRENLPWEAEPSWGRLVLVNLAGTKVLVQLWECLLAGALLYTFGSLHARHGSRAPRA